MRRTATRGCRVLRDPDYALYRHVTCITAAVVNLERATGRCPHVASFRSLDGREKGYQCRPVPKPLPSE
jgi:hypothetical protein